MKNYYTLLSLPSTATYVEIKQGVLEKLDALENKRGQQEQKYALLESWYILGKEERRTEYDIFLQLYEKGEKGKIVPEKWSTFKRWLAEAKQAARKFLDNESTEDAGEEITDVAGDIIIKGIADAGDAIGSFFEDSWDD